MLCLVVALLLFCDPLMPLSVSFWLSVGAVTCLIVVVPICSLSIIEWRHQKLSRKVRWILGLFHLQLGLLIYLRLFSFSFNGLALNGFLANLIAVPLYSFLLVPLILFCGVDPWCIFFLASFKYDCSRYYTMPQSFPKVRICRFRLIYPLF